MCTQRESLSYSIINFLTSLLALPHMVKRQMGEVKMRLLELFTVRANEALQHEQFINVIEWCQTVMETLRGNIGWIKSSLTRRKSAQDKWLTASGS